MFKRLGWWYCIQLNYLLRYFRLARDEWYWLDKAAMDEGLYMCRLFGPIHLLRKG